MCELPCCIHFWLEQQAAPAKTVLWVLSLCAQPSFIHEVPSCIYFRGSKQQGSYRENSLVGSGPMCNTLLHPLQLEQQGRYSDNRLIIMWRLPSCINFGFVAGDKVGQGIEQGTPEAVHAARQVQMVGRHPKGPWLQSKAQHLHSPMVKLETRFRFKQAEFESSLNTYAQFEPSCLPQ